MPQPASIPVKVPLATQPLGTLASLRAARENIVSIIPEQATTHPIVSGRTGKRWHMVTEPGAIRHILLEKLDNYPKSVVTKTLLKPAIGDSLFIAEGAHWRWQRRTAAPVFSQRNVMTLAPIMTAAAERAVARIAVTPHRVVNLFDEMVTTTFEVIADVTFSEDGGFDRDAVHHAIDDYIEKTGKLSLLDMLGVPRPGRMMSTRAMEQMRAEADRAIDARGPADVPDLLDLLALREDPQSGRRMTTAELRDNLLTFIVAGHETTALTLAWSLYLCAFDLDERRPARTWQACPTYARSSMKLCASILRRP